MPVITISCLGSKGRAGNSMFQYSFAKAYALAMGCELQTPSDWWGRKVFVRAANDPVIDRVLPRTVCDSVCLQNSLKLGYFFGKTDIDLDLYGQHQVFLDFYTRKQVRKWFRIKPEFELYSPSKEITGAYSAMHLRRGDYTSDPTFKRLYATISEESYVNAIKKFSIPRPVICVFDGCNPEIEELQVLGLDWLVDFFILRDADHLLRSNSTFSWWASVLGDGITYAPVVGSKTGIHDIEFVQGNWPTTAGIFQNQSDLWLKEE